MVRQQRLMGATGALFVVAFAMSLALLSEELGAFGDSDRAFVEHFSSGSQRAADIVGFVALTVAAAAFMYFAHLIATGEPDASDHTSSSLVRTGGILTGIFMLLAALALVTVPLSISLGGFFDEDGGAFGEGQAVLPQFGFVALVFGAMVPAAVTIVAVARLGEFPKWLTRLSYPAAALLAVSSGSVVIMVLLPVWVALSTVALTRPGGPPTLS